MAVRRIVANIAAPPGEDGAAFYQDVLGLDRLMDLGFITTWGHGAGDDGAGDDGQAGAPPQVGVASEGGSGAPVPDLSVEVDNLEDVFARAEAGGFDIPYPLTDEPWGVRRFMVRDPFGRLVNILTHI